MLQLATDLTARVRQLTSLGANQVLPLFNRSRVNQQNFITYQIREYGRPAYTGPSGLVTGIYTPTVQLNVFAATQFTAIGMADTLNTFFTGFQGYLNPAVIPPAGSIWVAKTNSNILIHTRDDEADRDQVVLDIDFEFQI
jgi:hypothetical protein